MKFIKVDKLIAHPNNPRMDLGDLTEMTDSIKKNGVLQNLTAVKHDTLEDMYTIIIGHRRHQAAKDAGLDEVPVKVVEMDDETQATTMLLENMQRSDLDVYEQARGIQQCLDLGLTESDIASKTGFSKSTVRRRVKLLELDQEKIKVARNATMEEYAMLEDVEDIDTKNELLKFIGTDQFSRKVANAVLDEEIKRTVQEVDDYLVSIGVTKKAHSYANYKTIEWYYQVNEKVKEEIKELDLSEGNVYFDIKDTSLYIFIDKPENEEMSEEDIEKELLKKEVEERKSKIDNIIEIEETLMFDFILKRVHETDITQKETNELIAVVTKSIINCSLNSIDYECLNKFSDNDHFEKSESYYNVSLSELGLAAITKNPIGWLITSIYSTLACNRSAYGYDSNKVVRSSFYDNQPLIDFVRIFGFEVSEEYQAIQDGTDELFDTEE